MDRRRKVELFEQLRREYKLGVGTIKGVAGKSGVHRRLVRQALATAVRLRVFERGGRPSSPVSVMLVELGGPALAPSVETDAAGEVTVPITGNTAGSWTWVVVPWRGQAPAPPTRLVPDQNEYFTLRVTPADADIAAYLSDQPESAGPLESGAPDAPPVDAAPPEVPPVEPPTDPAG